MGVWGGGAGGGSGGTVKAGEKELLAAEIELEPVVPGVRVTESFSEVNRPLEGRVCR